MNDNPEIRVFVSSTFRDMHEEREQLARRVGPQLRRMASERGVVLSLIDLRWGITAEQAEGGHVVPICLRLVERCRPYFIGVLGSRYGWIPSAIGTETTREFPWLERSAGASLTELEIRCGALNEPRLSTGARFYFRAPEYSEELAKSYSNIADTDPSSRTRLEALKSEIRESGLALLDGYRSAEELGNAILADLERIIDDEFPKSQYASGSGRQPNWVENMDDPDGPKGVPLAYHRKLHVQSELLARQVRGVFVGRTTYLERLDAFVTGDARFLGIHGAAGIGKSALLAAWATFAENASRVTIHHSVAPYTDWPCAVKQIAYELDELDGISHGPFPDLRSPAIVTDVFARASADRTRVLVLDGIDDWNENACEQAAELLGSLPVRVRLICGARDRRALESIAPPDGVVMELGGLDPDEQRDFISEHLARYGKSLSEAHLAQLLSHGARSPMDLLTEIEELRVFGRFEELGRVVEKLAHLKGRTELYVEVLERLENDFRRPDRNLVAEAFAALALARGSTLAEADWESLLCLPPFGWAELRDGLRDLLRAEARGLTFRDPDLRAVAERRYTGSEDERRSVHAALAAHFSAAPTQPVDLPYHLAQAGDWTGLRECLLDFELGPRLNEPEWRQYWTTLRAHFDPEQEHIDAMASLPTADAKYFSRLWSIGGYLQRAGYHRAAEFALRRALALSEKETRSYILRDVALLLLDGDRIDEARAVLEGEPSVDESADLLALRGMIEEHHGNDAEAEQLYQRSLTVSARSGWGIGQVDQRMTATVHMKLAHLCARAERLEEAERFARSAFEASDEPNMRAALADILASRASASEAAGRLYEAVERLGEAVQALEPVAGAQQLAQALERLGWDLLLLQRTDEASEAYERALGILTDGDQTVMRATLLSGLGFARNAKGRPDEATPLFVRALAIYEAADADYRGEIATARAGLARALTQRGEYAEAEACLHSARDAFTALHPNHASLPGVAISFARLYAKSGRLTDAEESYREAVALADRLDGADTEIRRAALEERAKMLEERGRAEEAEALRASGHTDGFTTHE